MRAFSPSFGKSASKVGRAFELRDERVRDVGVCLASVVGSSLNQLKLRLNVEGDLTRSPGVREL